MKMEVIVMPTYDYRCDHCGKFQFTQSIKEKPLSTCPTCGKPVKRLIGKNVNIVFKGSGFYKTDSKSGTGNNETSSDKAC
jgi:putative FmdB family regulatory protein